MSQAIVLAYHHPVCPSRLVYGVAQYNNNDDLITATDYPNNLRGSWNAVYGYIVHSQIAPVIVVEFGTRFVCILTPPRPDE